MMGMPNLASIASKVPQTALGWTSEGMSNGSKPPLMSSRVASTRIAFQRNRASRLACSEKTFPVSHRARDYVREVLTFQREEALHPLHRVIACLQGDPPFPANPVGVVHEERKRLFLSRVDQHHRLGKLVFSVGVRVHVSIKFRPSCFSRGQGDIFVRAGTPG